MSKTISVTITTDIGPHNYIYSLRGVGDQTSESKQRRLRIVLENYFDRTFCRPRTRSGMASVGLRLSDD